MKMNYCRNVNVIFICLLRNSKLNKRTEFIFKKMYYDMLAKYPPATIDEY